MSGKSKEKIMRGTAKEKIIEVATDLFYRQGYNATGIQQIIDEAGVSKGTFYTHFKSKEALGLCYLQKRHNDELAFLEETLAKIKNPHKKYFEFNTIMRDWMVSSDYRGCAFANMAAEVTDGKSAIRKQAKIHYEGFRTVIRDVVETLLKSDKKYRHLNKEYVVNQFMMLQIGALTNAEIYQDTWPYKHAEKSMKLLIGEKE